MDTNCLTSDRPYAVYFPKDSPVMGILNKNGCKNEDPHEGEELTTEDAKLVEFKGNPFLPRSQVKEVFLHANVFLKHDCQSADVPSGTHHHAHVGGDGGDLKVLDNSGHPWVSLEVYKDNVGQICSVAKSIDCTTFIRTIEQIARGIAHLHSIGRPHGNLAANCVFLSCDDRKHPIIIKARANSSPSSVGVDQEKEKDIRDLGQLFYLLLTNGETYDPQSGVDVSRIKCREKETAGDLLKKMLKEENCISIEKVLKHPLFWSEHAKVQFLIDVFDSVSPKSDEVKNMEEEANRAIFDKGDWKRMLKLTYEEADEVKLLTKCVVNKDKIIHLAGVETKKIKTVVMYIYESDSKRLDEIVSMDLKKSKKLTATENPPPEHEEAIFDKLRELYRDIEKHMYRIVWDRRIVFVNKPVASSYDKESFYDLLRFFRNLKEHFVEKDSQTKACFKAAGGYWNFFNSRFPYLITLVYNHMESFPYCKNVAAH